MLQSYLVCSPLLCTPFFFHVYHNFSSIFDANALSSESENNKKKQNHYCTDTNTNETKCIPVANKWNEAHQLISLKRRLICNDKWNFTSNCFAGRQHIFIQQTMTNAFSSRNCMPIWFCCYVLCAFNVVDFFFNCFLISLDWFVTPFQNIHDSVPSVSI